MDGYIPKPINPADLLAEIERFTRCPEPTPQMAPSPSRDDCIDWQVTWANLEGDRDLLSELALVFLDDLPEQLAALHRAVDNMQNRDLERLAHRLKGSVGNFAAKPAFEAAFRLEKIACQGNSQQISQAADALEYEIQRLRDALQGWAHKPSGNGGTDSPLPPSPASAASNSVSATGCG
jgi:HPt (histidine-containing phosphotransfer) domain-containing protein